MDKIKGMIIYNFMNGRDVSASFSDSSHNSEYSFEEFIEVNNEEKSIKSEINKLMRSEDITQSSLLEQLSSDLLEVEIILNKMIGSKSFEEFKESFNKIIDE